MSDQVLVAVIGGGFSVVVAMLTLIDKRNNRDHANNAAKLDRIETKIDSHIVDHAKGEFE